MGSELRWSQNLSGGSGLAAQPLWSKGEVLEGPGLLPAQQLAQTDLSLLTPREATDQGGCPLALSQQIVGTRSWWAHTLLNLPPPARGAA